MKKIDLQRFTDPIEGVVAPMNTITPDAGESVTTTGVEIKMPEKDLRTVIVLVNTGESAITATLLAPAEAKRTYAGSDTDVAVSVPAGNIALVPIESAKYATKDGIVKIKGSASGLKVVAFKRWEN